MYIHTHARTRIHTRIRTYTRTYAAYSENRGRIKGQKPARRDLLRIINSYRARRVPRAPTDFPESSALLGVAIVPVCAFELQNSLTGKYTRR